MREQHHHCCQINLPRPRSKRTRSVTVIIQTGAIRLVVVDSRLERWIIILCQKHCLQQGWREATRHRLQKIQDFSSRDPRFSSTGSSEDLVPGTHNTLALTSSQTRDNQPPCDSFSSPSKGTNRERTNRVVIMRTWYDLTASAVSISFLYAPFNRKRERERKLLRIFFLLSLFFFDCLPYPLLPPL